MSIQPDRFTKIANDLLDQLIKIRVPGEAMQVFLFIVRKTYGFNKKTDKISLSQFVAATGLNKPAVCRAIFKLKSMGLIVIKKDNAFIEKDNSGLTEYGVNKVCEDWQPLSKKITLSKKIISIIEKDNLPLSKKIPTKDNITKDNVTKETKAKKPPPQTEIPESLNTSQFIEAWHLWLQHRKEIRKPVTPTSTREQLKKLADIGVDRATAAIMHSIQKGYQGIFENRNSESMRGSQAEAYEALKNFKIMEDDQNENTD